MAHKQREFVNREFGKATRGKHLSLRERKKLLKDLWREAKKLKLK